MSQKAVDDASSAFTLSGGTSDIVLIKTLTGFVRTRQGHSGAAALGPASSRRPPGSSQQHAASAASTWRVRLCLCNTADPRPVPPAPGTACAGQQGPGTGAATRALTWAEAGAPPPGGEHIGSARPGEKNNSPGPNLRPRNGVEARLLRRAPNWIRRLIPLLNFCCAAPSDTQIAAPCRRASCALSCGSVLCEPQTLTPEWCAQQSPLCPKRARTPHKLPKSGRGAGGSAPERVSQAWAKRRAHARAMHSASRRQKRHGCARSDFALSCVKSNTRASASANGGGVAARLTRRAPFRALYFGSFF